MRSFHAVSFTLSYVRVEQSKTDYTALRPYWVWWLTRVGLVMHNC